MSEVKPLKLSDDNESVPIPQEFDVTDDYIAARGLSLEGLTTHLIEKSGDNIQLIDPNIGSRKAQDFLRYSLMLGGG